MSAMRFIRAANISSKNNSAWTPLADIENQS